ncbi:MAG: hypothetical protein JSV97_05855 [candidate division WOR-3 bacterium]|nr:MAG: hypothetical protein JSV97_05855 [candidate division WOR-3 bacterium]
MRKFFAIVLLASLSLLANPIAVEIINEFQTDTLLGHKVEFHETYPSGDVFLLNDTVVTPAGMAIIDTNLYLPESGYVVIDTSVLSGPFYLPPDSGFIKVYWEIFDTVVYPYDGYYDIIPAPPAGASAAKFYCWVNEGMDMWMLKDWYIDYTPTLGYENDDYIGCHVSGYVYGDGLPISGAQVTTHVPYPIYTPHPFYDQCTTYTGPDGLYAFDSLLPSRFYVKVNAAGYCVDSQQTDPLHSLEPLTEFNFTLVGIQEHNMIDVSGALYVHPNPFTHSTQIRFTIQDAGYTIQNTPLQIFDAAGRLVKSFLLPTDYSATQYGGLLSTAVSWDGTNDYGRLVAPGVYFILLPGKKIKVVKL